MIDEWKRCAGSVAQYVKGFLGILLVVCCGYGSNALSSAEGYELVVNSGEGSMKGKTPQIYSHKAQSSAEARCRREAEDAVNVERETLMEKDRVQYSHVCEDIYNEDMPMGISAAEDTSRKILRTKLRNKISARLSRVRRNALQIALEREILKYHEREAKLRREIQIVLDENPDLSFWTWDSPEDKDLSSVASIPMMVDNVKWQNDDPLRWISGEIS